MKKRIVILIMVVAMIGALEEARAIACSGTIVAKVHYKYEWPGRKNEGTVFKDGTGIWKGDIELNHVWNIFSYEPFEIRMALEVKSAIPYINNMDGEPAYSWLFFTCASIVHETELRFKKAKIFCSGFPYFYYDGEIFYEVPLSLEGTIKAVPLPEDEFYFRLKGKIKGLSQSVYFLHGDFEAKIWPGWDE